MLLRLSKSCKRTVSDGFVKKNLWTRTRFRIHDEGIINLYTLAIEHSACPLVGGKCGDDARLRRTDATQPQANAPCDRQQCRGDTLASGHFGQLAATGSRCALQHCTVRSAPRPLNNVLPPSTLDLGVTWVCVHDLTWH